MQVVAHGRSGSGMQRPPLAAAARATTAQLTARHWSCCYGPTLSAALDPVSRRDEQPSPQCLQRVQRDLAEFAHHPPPGVFIEPEEEDITTIHAIIVGPEGTPYEGGFFHFMLKCPRDYPVVPPLARIITTDSGREGFNPNLCSNGKVCLSILGTFPGPQWSSAHSLKSVLVSIQSLLNENPLASEPGIGHLVGHWLGRLSGYNDNLRYQTLRVAVCDAVEACLLGTAPYPPALRETVLARFAENYAKYEKAVSDPHSSSFLWTVLGTLTGESQQYKALLPRMQDFYGHYKHGFPLKAAVKASMAERSAQSFALYSSHLLPAFLDPVSRRHEQPSPQCLQRVQRDLAEFAHHPPPGVFIEPEKEDITTIHAIIVGPEGTPYEGGFFHFMLKCPRDYPVEPPLARIMTTNSGLVGFNSNFRYNGKVCLSILGTSPGPQWSSAHSLESVLVSIQSLFIENPLASEPGIGHLVGHWLGRLSGYNDNLRYQTLRVAVCDAVEACLLGTAPYPPALRETVVARFAENYAKYEKAVSDRHGSSFLCTVLGTLIGKSQQYEALLPRMQDFYGHYKHGLPLAAAVKASMAERSAQPCAPYFEPPLPAIVDPVSRRHEQPSPQCLQRVQRDLAELARHLPPGVFVEPEEKDITTIHAIIVGPEGTPYEGGFFHFVLKCPRDYPVEPPLARIMTTNSGLVGFNSNFCKNGKVCPSILDTTPGPQWSSVNSLESVLVSTQSLLNENPLASEPGIGHLIGHWLGRLSGYNDNLRYQTLRVAVYDAAEACLLGTALYPPALRKTVLALFAENYAKYEKAVSDPHGSSFLWTVLGTLTGESQQYKALLPRMQDLYGRVPKNASSAQKET
ncbi:uncharacterized protein [Dermacentor andersoni]|uniref:uncharacterized protein n=1 Tax=Dermacentor andersoni TaxID=34620 RepID=UPI003B3AC927